MLTDKWQQNWQEDESVRSSNQHNSQIHTEVEHLENLWLGERQHDNTAELSQCDTGQNLVERKKTKLN